ncbi:Type I inositol 1,4,5-trisphosphate 5-phosphatase CVP2 [Acorus calamus]|uniref:Type I inositol 1,4,5-trisphosphate 5-phosphatase CVP2 n=1 Tax=Acorus calamus TaxID=4465 RepID=A0AAV9EJZ1_ACOCL|nr:Type I inositol 1,4,5-trisphosphate 5-phosphatase CVP2 [Acorus calamus]
MEDWLGTHNNSHDIYVLGSQEHKERQKVYPVREASCGDGAGNACEFRCILSKQMVGIFVSVWLRLEVTEGRTFEGWREGTIGFSPTYKYYPNTNEYYGGTNGRKGEKRRAPAWCDRILWHGRGLKQTEYGRGESRLSDHRPVQAVFVAEVDISRRSTRDLDIFEHDLEEFSKDEFSELRGK